jgi:hypothetical protein
MSDLKEERLSDRQLSLAYWYYNNKERIKKAIIILLIIVNIFLWSYLFYYIIYNFVIYQKEYDKLLNNLTKSFVTYQDYREDHQPSDIEILGVTSIAAGNNKYDLIAQVRNSNENWLAKTSFKFYSSNFETEENKVFILPNSNKFLLDLGIKSDIKISKPRLAIMSQRWKYIHNYEQIAKERLNFEILDKALIRTTSLKLGKSVQISKLNFKVVNNSNYNFWDVSFAIVVFNGDTPVGVNYITVDSFDSGEIKNLEVNWFNPIGNVTSIEIKPDINILNPWVFKDFKARDWPDIRDYYKNRR